MELSLNDGYLNGSNVEYGYVAILDGFECEKKPYVFDNGEVGTSLVSPTHMVKSNKKIIIYKNPQSNNHSYDTISFDDCWHLVQYTMNGGLFNSEEEALNCVNKYLLYINFTNEKAKKETYDIKAINVSIKKIKFECSMKIVND